MLALTTTSSYAIPNNVCRKNIRPSRPVGTVFLQKSLNQSNTFNHGRPQIGISYVTESHLIGFLCLGIIHVSFAAILAVREPDLCESVVGNIFFS